MQQRLSIITLGVRDLKKSEHFYSNIFGWEKMPSDSDAIIFYSLNGIRLALYPRQKLADDAQIKGTGNGFPGFTIAYNARSIEEVDQIFKRMVEVNVNIIKKPEKVFWGGYSGYIADPDDFLWEIAYNPFMEIDDDGNVK